MLAFSCLHVTSDAERWCCRITESTPNDALFSVDRSADDEVKLEPVEKDAKELLRARRKSPRTVHAAELPLSHYKQLKSTSKVPAVNRFCYTHAFVVAHEYKREVGEGL